MLTLTHLHNYYRALNHIFLIQDSESGQIIDKQLWDRVIQQVYQEYPPPDLPEDWLSKCNEMSKVKIFLLIRSSIVYKT